MNKRQFLKGMILFIPAGQLLETLARQAEAAGPGKPKPAKPDAEPDMGLGDYQPADHWYGMGIEIDKCIGCNRCAEACKAENDVPQEPFFFRTWVERYRVMHDGEARVECISVNPQQRGELQEDRDVLRTFFVPKLCNQCAHPPCVQVCPVGATFSTRDGVVLIDKDRCIGCRYCIQACPYGARYFDHRTSTADKCTFCYHRITRGLLPACVEVCPTQARIFGDLRSKASRLVRFQRMNKIGVLKPALNTEPKVYYAQLDGEVR
ncbi:MAG: 4Fe-4S dicluster domain-containing protein [Candidatus Eisenbacteria bacterium]|nr:4Fe-4S dicluster domain-containing protein [Candidatus Eisenbacteria bacterium]